LGLDGFLGSTGEILPLFLLPGTEDDPDGGHLGELIVHILLQGVPLHVNVLQVRQELEGFHLDVGNEVLASDNLDKRGDLGEDGGHLDEGVGGEVDGLEGGAVGQLVGQARYPVVGHIQFCEQGPLDGELGGDLVDDVVGEVARDQARVLHQHEDRVRHLLQLAV